MAKSKLIKIDNNFDYKFDVKNNETNNLVFLIVPNSINESINININSLVGENSNITMNIIVVNNNKNNVVIKANATMQKPRANVFLNTLIYGFDFSNTQISSEFIVLEGSDQCFADQKINGLLLSDKCKIKGEPILVINCLDCKAEHSLKIGALDPEEIFYLETKGINFSEAQKLLTDVYINELIQELDDNDKNICLSSLKFQKDNYVKC